MEDNAKKNDVISIRFREKSLAEQKAIGMVRTLLYDLCTKFCQLTGGALDKVQNGILIIKGATREKVVLALESFDFEAYRAEIVN